MPRRRVGLPQGHGSYVPVSDAAEIQRRNDILRLVESDLSQREVSRMTNTPQSTISRWTSWKATAEAQNLPLKTGLSLRGRKRKLDADDVHHLSEMLREKPFMSTRGIVNAFDGKLSTSAASCYVKELGFGMVMPKVGNRKLSRAAIQKTRQYVRDIRTIPEDQRVYEDESGLYLNEHQHYCYARAGEFVSLPLSKNAQRVTLYWAISREGPVHEPYIRKSNCNDAEFMKYVTEVLAPSVPRNNVMIWDRLGTAGRCPNPTKQHFNPEARRILSDNEVQVKFLPPEGKNFNPMEVALNSLKSGVRDAYAESQAYADGRPYTVDELKQVTADVATSFEPRHYEGWFRERAGTRAFKRVYPNVHL